MKPTRPFLLRLAARAGASRHRPKSVSRAALRLVVVSLFTLALLPPLSWGFIGLALEWRAVTVEHSLGDLAFTTAIIAVLSVALALALWGWAFMRPVSRLQRAERRVRTYEFTDRLTGLHDRQEFRRRLTHALARARGSGMQLGILVIDVDRFGLVNGSLGQEAGDLLLHSVAQRLRSGQTGPAPSGQIGSAPPPPSATTTAASKTSSPVSASTPSANPPPAPTSATAGSAAPPPS